MPTSISGAVAGDSNGLKDLLIHNLGHVFKK
jgi:hypothetical protein